MTGETKLSVIVCTYNRAGILSDCLQSLSRQSATKNEFEVIIIDNNSSDSTKSVAENYIAGDSNFTYHFEPIQGLSHARNTGYKVARYDWVAYIDDDARAFPDFVERALWAISNCPFDAFGGRFIHWFKFGRPKWFPANFEGNGIVNSSAEPIVLTSDFFFGGVMVLKKAVLEQAGGFPTDLGMRGKKIAYGEENALQLRLREAGFSLGYDPNLVVEHLVNTYKLKLWWHIQSAFAHGRDGQGINYSRFGRRDLLIALAQSLFAGWPKSLGKFFLHKDFFWQNMALEMIQPIAVALGKYHASRKKLPKEH